MQKALTSVATFFVCDSLSANIEVSIVSLAILEEFGAMILKDGRRIEEGCGFGLDGVSKDQIS
jgi:hypothetical protein